MSGSTARSPIALSLVNASQLSDFENATRPLRYTKSGHVRIILHPEWNWFASIGIRLCDETLRINGQDVIARWFWYNRIIFTRQIEGSTNLRPSLSEAWAKVQTLGTVQPLELLHLNMDNQREVFASSTNLGTFRIYVLEPRALHNFLKFAEFQSMGLCISSN